MKIADFEKCPAWLKSAITKDAEVEWGDGVGSWVVWRGGYFLGGNFRGADFRGGYFSGGNFQGGDFHGGNFIGGNFLWGRFIGGDFHWGNFIGGDFLGGRFIDGDFRGGNFIGGTWTGGRWHGGFSAIRSKHLQLICDDGLIKIGCATKTIEDWDKWFSGSEELETKRGTIDFIRIHAHFLAVKAYVEHLAKFKVEK